MSDDGPRRTDDTPALRITDGDEVGPGVAPRESEEFADESLADDAAGAERGLRGRRAVAADAELDELAMEMPRFQL